MATDSVHDDVRTLVERVRREPTTLPMAELCELHASGADVVVDRVGDETVVIVDRRRPRAFAELSPRELEVAELIASGATNAEIARALFISIGTVKDHVHAVLRKTGQPSRARLIATWFGG